MLSRLLLARSIRNHSENDNSWDTFIGLLAPTAWYKLHEPNGLVAGDSSGNGKDAVYPASGITFNQPSGLINIGNGITNIASSNFFTQRAHDAAFDVRGDITLVATVKIAASHPNYPKIIWQPTDIFFGRGTWYLAQDYVNSGGRFVFRISIGGTNTDVVSTTVPMVGVTYLVVCRRSGTTMDMYINGIKEATRSSVTGMADIASLPFMLGGSGSSDGNGSVISNVAIFNRALYDEDIVALYGMAVGASGDPYWNKVKSLLHYNGPDGSTVFTDEKNNVISSTNGALITAGAGPWGGSCANLTSGNSQIFSSAPAANFDLGAGDFTVETMLKVPATIASTGCIMGKWNGNGQYCWMMGIGVSNGLGFSASNTGYYIPTYDLSVANVIIPNKWQHIAVCKSGTTLRFFVEGVLKSTASLPISVFAGNTYWGEGFNGISQKARAYLAESRITVGIARYTTDFTPYTRPFYNRSVDG